MLAPLLASVGIPVAKMSGQGLEHAGGTIDKLEAIRGLRLPETPAQIRAALDTVGFALAGQTGDLAPGDGALYRLRDVTGTVESLPLIAASIMSKKIAAGTSAVVLDVKTGSGAILRSPDDVLSLAKTMVTIGEHAGLPTRAVVSDMDQPLGYAIGNALDGPARPAPCQSARLTGVATAARRRYPRGTAGSPHRGAGLRRLPQVVAHHGGDTDQIDHPDRLPRAARVETLTALTSGWVTRVDAAALGRLCQRLGAGRTRLNQPIDHAVGLRLHTRVGDHITTGAHLVDLHLPATGVDLDRVSRQAVNAFTIANTALPSPALIQHTL